LAALSPQATPWWKPKTPPPTNKAVIAPTAAIVNGAIGLLAIVFFRDRMFAKAALAALIVFSSVARVGSMLYHQHQIISRNLTESARNRQVREGIGGLIAEGNALMDKCADQKSPPPMTLVDSWKSRAQSYLSAQLGNSYAVRFGDPNGIPAVMLSDPSNDAAHQVLWYGIYFRVFRLEEIIRQIP
jgi:hypothetical protein